MAEQKLNIVVGGEDRSKPAFKSVAQSLSDLKKTAGEGGQLGEFAKMARGAGAVAGIALAARTLTDLTGKAVSFRDAMREGSMSAGDVADQLARSIPVLGSIYAAGRNLRELITGQQAEINKMLASAAAQDGNIANRRSLREAVASSQGAFGRRQEALVNSFSSTPTLETRQITQATRNEIFAINKVLADARKTIDASTKFSVPGEDGKARELQGIAALREEFLKIIQNPEATRKTSVGRDRQGGGSFTTEARELQDRAQQIRARIGESQRAIAAAEVQAERTIAMQSARGYTDLGKLFLSEVRKRFDEGVDAQLKQNATTVDIQMKDTARTVAAREAARDAFGGVLKSVIGGTLDAVGDAVGGKQGAEKYLRENGQFGLAFRLLNEVAKIGGNGSTAPDARTPLGQTSAIAVSDQRYATAINRPEVELARAQAETAKSLKAQESVQAETRDLMRQMVDLIRSGNAPRLARF